jgi:TonB family protein
MRTLFLALFVIFLFNSCEKKNSVDVIPAYDSIYLSPDNVDKPAQLVDGDENKLISDIRKEMKEKSQSTINLEYKLLLNESGKVDKILTVKSDNTVYSDLIASEVGSWKFEPALKNNKPVKSQYKWEYGYPPNTVIDENDFKATADTMPFPVGGMKSLQQNIIYPEKAKQKGIEGKVIVQAYIDQTGKVVKTSVLKSAGDELDQAAMNALQKTRFTPGIIDGKPVKVRIVIPIVFKLS